MRDRPFDRPFYVGNHALAVDAGHMDGDGLTRAIDDSRYGQAYRLAHSADRVRSLHHFGNGLQERGVATAGRGNAQDSPGSIDWS